MNQRKPAEPVIQFLRGLTCDGVLSSDEIWSLAHWLNEQPAEVQSAWPASALIPVLKGVFEDGHLTEEEMKELVMVLGSIQEIWCEQFARGEEDEIVLDPQVPPKIEVPRLPTIPFHTVVVGENCSIDLSAGSCTCPDWRSNRFRFPNGDFRRACLHVIHGYRKLEASVINKLDPWFKAFLRDHQNRNRGTSPREEWKRCQIGNESIIYSTMPDRDWIFVYAPSADGYQRFSYNPSEGRWSYGESPRRLGRALRELFTRRR